MGFEYCLQVKKLNIIFYFISFQLLLLVVLLGCFLLCFLSSFSSTAWRKKTKAATIWARNLFTRKLPPLRSMHERILSRANSNMNSHSAFDAQLVSISLSGTINRKSASQMNLWLLWLYIWIKLYQERRCSVATPALYKS